jgi:hypothetical protein
MKICGTCKKPVVYVTTNSRGLWQHTASGNWRCEGGGDANTSQIDEPEVKTPTPVPSYVLQIGDVVSRLGHLRSEEWEVIGVDGYMAWVRHQRLWGTPERAQCPIDSLVFIKRPWVNESDLHVGNTFSLAAGDLVQIDEPRGTCRMFGDEHSGSHIYHSSCRYWREVRDTKEPGSPVKNRGRGTCDLHPGTGTSDGLHYWIALCVNWVEVEPGS